MISRKQFIPAIVFLLLGLYTLSAQTPTATFVTKTTLSIPTGCVDKVTQTTAAVTIVQTCTYTPAPPPVTGNATITVPAGVVAKPYSINVAPLIAAKGGVPPYTYSAQSGFPTWLSITPLGVLAGTPTVAGTFNLVIGVNDSSGGTTSASHFTVTVQPRSGR